MPSRFTRYLRWRLAESGLVPRSATGKLFLYALVVALISYLGREIGNRISAGAGDWFNVPLVFAYFVFVPLGIFVAFRWIRNRVLWRLRNRLLVTYVFIGVIPVLLVVTAALVAGYVFAGQFATYLASSDLQSEVQSLSAANSALANDLAARIRRRAAADRSVEEIEIAHLGERFSDAQVAAWYRGRPLVLRADQQHDISEPVWLTRPAVGRQPINRFDGVVLQGEALHLRSGIAIGIGNDRLVVVSSAPLSDARVAQLATGLGRIVVGGGTVNIVEEDEEGRSGLRVSVNDRDTREQTQAQQQGRSRTVTRVTGGTVPVERNRFDKFVQFFFPLSTTEWSKGPAEAGGQPNYIPLIVETRLSTLYERLFLRAAPWANIWFVVLGFVAITFAVIELIALLIGIGLTRTVTRSVHKLYEATQRVNRGDFRHRIAVKSNDQLATLEKSFNSMVENLEELIAEQKEKERLQSELAIAQEVQAQLFPREIKQLETFELHGVCRPARIVSGDYYDFIPLGADRLGIAVGDISGKGISAALLMATLHSAVRAFEFGRMPHSQGQLVTATSVRPVGTTKLHEIAWQAAEDGRVSTAEVMSLLNHHLYASTPLEKYATLFLGTFDSPTRQMTYTNAGHLPPLIIAGDGSVRRLHEGGLVIGLFDDLSFEERTIQLHPGDIFVAYSDGITEPENEFGEFGEARLIQIVRENRHLPLERISELVVGAVQDWIGSNEQPDDVTLVLARVRS